MNFEKYMQEVIDYFMVGGVTWESSYMRVLKQHSPELADQVERVGLNPIAHPAVLGDFLHLVFTSREK